MSDGARLGIPGGIALVMGGMIGTGVFMIPASLAPYGWNAVVGWIVTIGGVLCLAWLVAALSRRHARAVGPAELVEHSFGRTAGFLIAFSYWISCWTSSAALAIGALSYLSGVFPALGDHPALWALGLIWLLTFVNLASIGLVSRVQVVTTILKLIPLFVVAILMVIVIGRTGTAHIILPTQGLSLGGINSAASLALFTMVGFEAACGAAHKIADPQRNVARVTMIGAALTGLIYLVVCSGIIFMLPADQVARTPAPFSLFIATHWSPGPAAVIGLFAAISAIGALNCWTLIQGEIPLEMTRRGMMPAWFGKTTPNGIAARSLLVSAMLASALVVFNGSQSMSGLFVFAALLTTSTTLWLYLAVALAAFKEGVARSVAVIASLYSLWALVGTGLEPALLGLLLMIAGLPLYWLARRRSDGLLPTG